MQESQGTEDSGKKKCRVRRVWGDTEGVRHAGEQVKPSHKPCDNTYININ